MSALPPKAYSSRTSRHVRLVAIADSCGAANSAPIRSPRRHGRISVALQSGERASPQTTAAVLFGTSRRNGSPEAQRWHAGAEGSLAQISGVCLSCIRYRVTAKSTRRIAMTIQILMRDIMGMKPRCEWNSPTGVREFSWRRVSSLGQDAGVSLYPARSMLRSLFRTPPAGPSENLER